MLGVYDEFGRFLGFRVFGGGLSLLFKFLIVMVSSGLMGGDLVTICHYIICGRFYG
jgi:hypothetical protein